MIKHFCVIFKKMTKALGGRSGGGYSGRRNGSLTVSLEGFECYVPNVSAVTSGAIGGESILYHSEGDPDTAIQQTLLLGGKRIVNGSPRSVLAGMIMINPSIVSSGVDGDDVIKMLFPGTVKNENLGGLSLQKSGLSGVARAKDSAKNQFLVASGLFEEDQLSVVFGNNLQISSGNYHEVVSPIAQTNEQLRRHVLIESFLKLFMALNSRTVGLLEMAEEGPKEQVGNKFVIRPKPQDEKLGLDSFLDLEKSKVRPIERIKKKDYLSENLEVPVEKPHIRLAQVGGNFNLRDEIDQIILGFKDSKIAKKWGVTPPKGVLLYGPEGTGKSMLAESLATEIGARIARIQSRDIYEKWLGKSEENIGLFFDALKDFKNGKLVVVIDEIEAIIKVGGSNETSDRVGAHFKTGMDELDNPRVLVVGITNHEDKMDPALKRSGRFDRKLYIDLPNEEERFDILVKYTDGQYPKKEDDFRRFQVIGAGLDLPEIARIATGLSGADLVEVFKRAYSRKFLEEHRTGIEPEKISTEDITKEINGLNTQ